MGFSCWIWGDFSDGAGEEAEDRRVQLGAAVEIGAVVPFIDH
jgi:hypothetical protein